MIHGHGGNIYQLAQELDCTPSDITDMSSNVNPLGPPSGLVRFLKENINLINALPQADAGTAVQAFSRRYDLNPDLVIPGNGTTQLIHSIPLALNTGKALIVAPAYSDYADACAMHRVNYEFFFTQASQNFQPDMKKLTESAGHFDTVFICNPNNPAGYLISADEIKTLCQSHPDTRFIIDESYLPFADNDEQNTMLHCRLSNVIILNSMSKIFRVPGLRIGFLLSSEPLIHKLKRYVMPWSVNSLAQAAVIYLMEQEEISGFINQTRKLLKTERQRMINAFKNTNIHFFPSCTSFLLGELSGNHTAENLCKALAHERILIRNCSNFQGLSEKFIRISLKDEDVNQRLIQKLFQILK